MVAHIYIVQSSPTRNVLQFAAGHGGATATATSKDIIVMAPDLLSEAPETAILKFKPDAVHALLHAGLTPDMSKLWVYKER